jgi:hypothetical protein
MLDDIARGLSDCAHKLQLHYSNYQNNLNGLRRQVVEPVLTILGWDLSNPSDVSLDGILNGMTIEYLKYGDIMDKETALKRSGIQAIVRVILPDEDVEDKRLIGQTEFILDTYQIPACIITNGTQWHFIAITKEKKLLNQVSVVENATDWLIYFARPNIMYVRIFLTLHMKTNAFVAANNLIKELLDNPKFGKDHINFWSMVERIKGDFGFHVLYQFPYFSELTNIDLFFDKHLAKWIDKGSDASAMRVVFMNGPNKGKVLFSELAKWVLIQTVIAVGLEKSLATKVLANAGEATIGTVKRQIRLVEETIISKIPQEEVEENGKTYFIAHSMSNQQKVEVMSHLSYELDREAFTVDLLYL